MARKATGSPGNGAAPTTEQTFTTREIVVSFPGPDAPGYLRRVRAFTKFYGKQLFELTEEDVVELARLLADFVKSSGQEDAQELIYDLSENEFAELMSAIGGLGGNQTDADIPLPSKPRQGDGLKGKAPRSPRPG